MLFNSLEFLVFFPVVTALYFLAPYRARWVILLVASCVFYAAFIPKYLLILAFLILVDYVAGRGIERAMGPNRRALLILSLAANLGLLGFFKYINFVDANLNALFTALGLAWMIPHLDIILPIGLSFHTFQSMSYTIEVYRGRVPAERHLGIYALYVMFYPQLVAGPIERPYNLLHQFREDHAWDWDRVADGLKLMTWGFFKKVVIADRLALYVNQIYNDPTGHTGWPLIVATYFFAFQIYCDFSGYTDIAIGAAQVMGFRLMDNFNRPYFSKSVAEFWRRWHISLSSWFRDYLYLPLGGNRVPLARWQANILLVFLLSGLWHGANWTFLAWGALHGTYIVIGAATAAWRRRFYATELMQRIKWSHRWIHAFVTFHLVLVAWVFFRAGSLADARYVLTHALRGFTMADFRAAAVNDYFFVSVVMIAIMEGVHLIERHKQMRRFLDDKPIAVRWAFYYALLLLIANFGMFHSPLEFIYFQF
jgi:D-alanyl-lipoteichoic acid acyltransferase DltB (MBOAT superfamily)